EFWEGDTEHRSGAYLDVREHSSTGSTSPKTDFEEFGKRSITSASASSASRPTIEPKQNTSPSLKTSHPITSAILSPNDFATGKTSSFLWLVKRNSIE
ncbi:MAG: palindromic element RPE1 domain-containing protein, partial [Holosporales bacterium]|nr:palindromic element RPE1 domain-containing protein [Holosporales bacterium]